MAGEYEVTRDITIDATADQVRHHVVDFHRWAAWSPWERIDPGMERTYSGPSEGVGATYSWSGNRKAGSGTMRITDVRPDRVRIALSFIKPFRSETITDFTLTPAGQGTHVEWTLRGPSTLATKVMGIFTSMDKTVGPDFERGLAALKRVSEAG